MYDNIQLSFNGARAWTKLWQTFKPVKLDKCEKLHGKGPFVHGYNAPVPWGHVGTGMGYWPLRQKPMSWLFNSNVLLLVA
jgi:hypothetical protein